MHIELTPGQQPPQAVLDYRPLPASLEKAEDALKESSQCFEKAIAIAPGEPEIYFQRAGYMIVSNWENCFFRFYRGDEKMDTSKWIAPQLSPETIANLKKAAEFSPGNCDFIGIEAFFEWMAAEMPVKFRSLTRDELPPDTRQSIDGSIARLQELSESPDEKLAAKAFEYLGMLNFISGNSREAASDFRRAVALDPTRERSWDMQLAMGLKDPDFPDEAVAICKSRLKYNNSARNHLFLSKAYQHKNEWSEAAAEAEVAANLDTNYIIAPLMLAAIDLEQSVDANLLPKAKEQLDHAYALLGRMNSGSESEQRWREISLNGAILCGLMATPDSEKMAKQVLGQVLKYYPGDETAKAILEALPGEDTVNDAQDD